jgi:hypothetical protein
VNEGVAARTGVEAINPIASAMLAAERKHVPRFASVTEME